MKEIYNGVDAVVRGLEKTMTHTDNAFIPIRKSVFRRFPTVFTILVTFGVSATFLGIERIILEIPWLNERPWFIFASGIFILILTGRLYKKLS